MLYTWIYTDINGNPTEPTQIHISDKGTPYKSKAEAKRYCVDHNLYGMKLMPVTITVSGKLVEGYALK